MRQHEHELDGTIHDCCCECERIVAVRGRVAVETRLDRDADRYAAVASRAPSLPTEIDRVIRGTSST